MRDNPKRSKIKHKPGDKSTTIRTLPSEFWSKKPLWRFSDMDWGFDFLNESWDRCGRGNNDVGSLKPIFCVMELQVWLKSFESLTWREIIENDNTGSHEIKLSDLAPKNPKAIERLRQKYATKLQNESIEGIFSLRVTGRKRIFGFMDKEKGIFSFLWWDPQHKIYPTKQ